MRETGKLIYEGYFDLFIWRKLLKIWEALGLFIQRKKGFFKILSWITIELFIYLIFHKCF